MSKDNYRLKRLGVLAPAALSACMDASVLAVPAAGAIVSTVLKELSKAFMLKKWFHGDMTAKEAEYLMMEKGKNGSFLVRESRGHPGDFVLTVRVRGRVTHVKIRKQHNKYDVGNGEEFDDLVGLIEHFRAYPMIETSGDVLRLLQPISSTYLPAKGPDPIPDMKNYNSNECDNKLYSKEFHSLQMMDNLVEFTINEGTKTENVMKNRYRNILPYDQTRVILRRSNEIPGGDYINANYIHSHRLGDCTQSSNESLDSVQSLNLGNTTKTHLPLVAKSLSDDALRELKRCRKLDKINGNWNSQAVYNKRYIATQGCLSNTIEDFWTMINQEDVRVIVMITKEFEKGKKKCERYWPQEGQSGQFDGISVSLNSEVIYDNYTVRELTVKQDKKCSRTVYQYQLTAWPDHSTPTDPNSVITLIQDIDKNIDKIMQDKNKPEQLILCVHCSAGVGRTGTFIVLDMLIDKIKNTGFNCDIDVHRTVKLVRKQRSGMVQNKSQYDFIYLALQKYIEVCNKQLNKNIINL